MRIGALPISGRKYIVWIRILISRPRDHLALTRLGSRLAHLVAEVGKSGDKEEKIDAVERRRGFEETPSKEKADKKNGFEQ
jgi:hypothetical protein